MSGRTGGETPEAGAEGRGVWGAAGRDTSQGTEREDEGKGGHLSKGVGPAARGLGFHTGAHPWQEPWDAKGR